MSVFKEGVSHDFGTKAHYQDVVIASSDVSLVEAKSLIPVLENGGGTATIRRNEHMGTTTIGMENTQLTLLIDGKEAVISDITNNNNSGEAILILGEQTLHFGQVAEQIEPLPNDAVRVIVDLKARNPRYDVNIPSYPQMLITRGRR